MRHGRLANALLPLVLFCGPETPNVFIVEAAPTVTPTGAPTVTPTDAPTVAPTGAPTVAPTPDYQYCYVYYYTEDYELHVCPKPPMLVTFGATLRFSGQWSIAELRRDGQLAQSLRNFAGTVLDLMAKYVEVDLQNLRVEGAETEVDVYIVARAFRDTADTAVGKVAEVVNPSEMTAVLTDKIGGLSYTIEVINYTDASKRIAPTQQDWRWTLVGENQTCATADVYTAANGCNGWSNVNNSKCKEYCEDDARPHGCMVNNSVECAFMVWTSGSGGDLGMCHLAGNCKLEERPADSASTEVWKKDHPTLSPTFVPTPTYSPTLQDGLAPLRQAQANGAIRHRSPAGSALCLVFASLGLVSWKAVPM